jgi:DedD protein
MDRSLKERVIGAVVLVIIAVLIVPIFLDGPSDDSEIVQEHIILPGQDGEGVKQKTVVLELDRDQPVPAPREGDKVTTTPPAQAVSAPPKTETVKTPTAATVKPAEEPKQAQPAPVSSTGMWAVQMGSFSSQANADRLAADLRKAGYAAFLSQLDTSSGKLHRVRVGPQKNRSEAEGVASKLAAIGHKGQVVPHP